MGMWLSRESDWHSEKMKYTSCQIEAGCNSQPLPIYFVVKSF